MHQIKRGVTNNSLCAAVGRVVGRQRQPPASNACRVCEHLGEHAAIAPRLLGGVVCAKGYGSQSVAAGKGPECESSQQALARSVQ